RPRRLDDRPLRHAAHRRHHRAGQRSLPNGSDRGPTRPGPRLLRRAHRLGRHHRLTSVVHLRRSPHPHHRQPRQGHGGLRKRRGPPPPPPRPHPPHRPPPGPLTGPATTTEHTRGLRDA